MADTDAVEPRQRTVTGISGLDEVMQGGLVSGSVYIVRGTPGAGKTILANQICFHRAQQGQHCLYITLLSESHDRLIENLRGLTFYSDEVIDRIQYQSGFHALEEEGPKGILRMMVEEMKRYDANLIVLDGVVALHEKVDSERQFRIFLNQLQNLAHLNGSTMLLLTNSTRGAGSPEYTMVDGWLELSVQSFGTRVARALQVHKLRGSGFIEGQHTVTISATGIDVLPRLESSITLPRHDERVEGTLPSGIPSFDTMISGGLRRGSNTVLVGPTGIGKTVFGLHFLSQSTPEEPGLIFGFHEGLADLTEKAEILGICDLERDLASGAVHLLWRAPTEHLLDSLGYDLIQAVRERGIKRLFVDGLNALMQSAIHPDRIARFLAALTHLLRNEGVTAVFTLETPELIGGEASIEFASISSIAQNIVLLRYAELGSATHRTLTVVKARTSQFDSTQRQFTITSGKGICIDGPFPTTGDLMTGHVDPRAPKDTGPQ